MTILDPSLVMGGRRCRPVVIGTIILFLGATLPGLSQESQADAEAGLTPGAAALLKAAAASEDQAALEEAVRLLIQTDPDRLPAIRKALSAMAPDRVEALAETIAPLGAPEPTAPATEGQAVASADAATQPETEAAQGETEGFFEWDAWEGQVNVGGSTTSGDVNEQAISLTTTIKQVIAETWDHTFNLNADFSRNNGVTNQERLTSGYELFYRGWERYFLSSLMRFEYDRFGSFQWRVTEAPSVGWTVYDRPAFEWTLQGGPGIRFTNLEEAQPDGTLASDTNTEFVFRFGSGLNWVLNDKVSLSDQTSLFVGPTTTTAENEIALTSKINSHLSASVSFNVRWDSNVPAGTSKVDTISRLSIGYSF